MPQSTTALPQGPERPQAGQPRIDIPTVEHDPRPPRRRPRDAEPDDAADDGLAQAVADADERAPKMERWLQVLLASAATAALALFVPPTARLALHVATGALMLAGLAMLIVQERRVARRSRARP